MDSTVKAIIALLDKHLYNIALPRSTFNDMLRLHTAWSSIQRAMDMVRDKRLFPTLIKAAYVQGMFVMDTYKSFLTTPKDMRAMKKLLTRFNEQLKQTLT